MDDDPKTLANLVSVLEPLGQNIVCAASGAEALREVLARDFALILIDVDMAPLDGFHTTQLIRARPRSRHTPIMFLAPMIRTVELMSRAYRLGAVDLLFKPIVPLILRAKVQAFVELHHRAAALARLGRLEHERAEQRWGTERTRLLSEITGRRRIPVDRAEEPSSPDSAPPRISRVDMPPLRVLVVEDDDDIRESMRVMFELEGQRTSVAADGPSGVEAILAERPDVAFIDIGLPGFDGYQVVSTLRSRAPDLPSRLVAVTAYGRPEDRERALAAGFHDHAVKPVSADDLLRLLEPTTKGPRAG